MYRSVGSACTYFKSWFNAKQYLDPVADKIQKFKKEKLKEPNSGPPSDDNDQKAYAVIYGCNNKAGKSFAYFLMQKGFNLILIERDLESI